MKFLIIMAALVMTFGTIEAQLLGNIVGNLVNGLLGLCNGFVSSIQPTEIMGTWYGQYCPIQNVKCGRMDLEMTLQNTTTFIGQAQIGATLPTYGSQQLQYNWLNLNLVNQYTFFQSSSLFGLFNLSSFYLVAINKNPDGFSLGLCDTRTNSPAGIYILTKTKTDLITANALKNDLQIKKLPVSTLSQIDNTVCPTGF